MTATGNGEGFAMIPNWIARTGYLDPFEFMLYAYLLGRAGRDGRCYPSLRTIARETGISLTKVRRTLDLLEERGIVRRTVKRTASGAFANTRFKVKRFELERPDEFGGGVPQAPPLAGECVSTSTTGDSRRDTPVVLHETRKENHSSTSIQVDDEVSPSDRRDENGEPTPKQLRYLADLTILAGDGIPTDSEWLRWADQLTADEVSARIDEHLRAAGRGVDYLGPVPGEPEFDALSDAGKTMAENEFIPNT